MCACVAMTIGGPVGIGSSGSFARHLHGAGDKLLPPSTSSWGADRGRQEGS